MPKLSREAGPDGQLGSISKKEKVEVHSEGDFHMCYFFRRMSQRHAVLLKEKNLVFPSSKANFERGNDPAAVVPMDDDAFANPNQSSFFQQFENSQAANAPIPRRKKRRLEPKNQNSDQHQDQVAQSDGGWGEMNLGMNLGMGFATNNVIAGESVPRSINSDASQVVRREHGDGGDLNGLSGSGNGNRDATLAPDSDEERVDNEDADGAKRNPNPMQVDDDVIIKREEEEDDDISFQGCSHPNPNSVENDNAEAEHGYVEDETMNSADSRNLGPAEEYDQNEEEEEEDEKPKPRLNVSYSGFRILGKSLVLVIEPSTRTKTSSDNAHLFKPVAPSETRQLNVTPVIDASGSSRRNRSSRSQSRFSSIQPPGNGRGREKSETPLFRGITPSSELDEDEFGSVPPSPARRDRSESVTTVADKGKGRAKRNFPPVPMFNDNVNQGNEDDAEVEELDEQARTALGGFNFANQLLEGEDAWIGGSEENAGGIGE